MHISMQPSAVKVYDAQFIEISFTDRGTVIC